MPRFHTRYHSQRKSPPLSRRDFLRLAGLAGAGLALPGCSQWAAQPTPTGAAVQLVYQDVREEWFLPVAHEMLLEFHASNPDIRVFYSPEPESTLSKEEKMLAEMQAGTAADVFQGCCYWFPIWAQKGYALDLRPFVEAGLDQATIDDWDPVQYNALFSMDGKQYALPKYHGALALFYNKDLFDQYGVSYPDGSWDHDDYLEAMRQLTHDTNGDGQTDLWGSQTYITWDRIQMHVNGWGGHFVDPADPRKTLIGAPESVAAHEWLHGCMWDEHVMATTLDTQNMWPNEVFAAGKTAMLEDGSWQLHYILSNANFRVGVAPFPRGPVKQVTLATTDGFGIYAGTQHPQESWELLKFLISPEYGRAMARYGFLQPARASLVNDWIAYIKHQFPEQAHDIDLSAFAEGHRQGYSVVAEVAADMAEATRITGQAWEEIFTLGKDPATVLPEAARQIDAAQQ